MAVSEREIKSWATWLRAAGRPGTTIDLRTYHVRRVMYELDVDPWSVTTEQLVEYLGAHDWKPNTRRAYRASLRAFYAWAQATGRRRDDPARLMPVIKVPRGVARPTPEIIYRQSLLDADDRVRLMIHLGAICGLRRGEISRVRGDDVRLDQDGHSLRVVGKGGHVRVVPLPAELARDIFKRGLDWTFPTTARSGGPLTDHHVGVLVSRALPPGWTCHTLRHRCGTVAYWASKDLRAVQELLGHAKPETTMIYTLVRGDDVRALVEITAA